MAPRLDPENLTLDLAVADLLETRLVRSLGFANRGGYERMWLGQAIHSRYQEQALEEDPTYQREVTVTLEFEHRGWQVRIRGRIDGLRRDPDGVRVIEEIKSVRRGGQLAPAVRELYQRQALLYAWMLQAQAQDLDKDKKEEIRAELVLIEIGSDETERQEVSGDLRGIEASVKRLLNSLLSTHEKQLEERQQRQAAAEALSFPFPEMRPGQEEILTAVETALKNREHVLVEAATGIGKTIAALYPTIRYCLSHNKRIFVLTAKTLQQEMAGAVLEMLNQHKAFHSLRLRAKAKMCANDQVICHEEYCPYARDYYQKLNSSAVLEDLLYRHGNLDPDSIYSAARKAEVCPFEVSLELGRTVQVTVCDYNYAFDPYVALSDFSGDEDLGDTILVIDEIHNLVSRGRGYYSPELGSKAAAAAADAMSMGGDPVHYQIQDICRRLSALIERTCRESLEEGGPYMEAAEVSLPEDKLWRLRPAFDAAFVDYLEYQRDQKSFRAEDPFVDLYFSFLRFLNGLVTTNDAFSHCVEKRSDGYWLRILCKDPSQFLGKVMERCHSVIGLSATLSPPEFYRDLLGFEPGRTATVAVANPFPSEQRRLVIDAGIATTWKERPRYYPKIAQRLGEMADSVPGNCLALFPSYDFLAQVAGQLQSDTKRVLVQHRADGDRERDEILETLRSAVMGDILLLAVAGGVFAEGVDYPGDMLKAVAVVGPCLPGVSLEQRLLKEYYDERFEKGFEYSFVVPGMTRVVQAAGRLIRSPKDSGVIALFDRRFLRKPYSRHLPADWIPEEGLKTLVGVPAKAAKEFFAAELSETEF
ncbi:MAG: DEAD/DEAH box helicase family protein [Deltaproteobacteria bacterium]|nr:DEAD/DEAH box helicase family protein [Deltaproteobacteria bacterium]